jgi:xanthine/uracil permease
MELSIFFVGFLQRIAVGAGTVIGLLLITWLGMPRRSTVIVHRRIR